MPQFGILHDDALYVVAGKSIADGLGPKISSMPKEPAQTKYPPGLPLLISLVWKAHPRFEGIRPWLTLLAWSFVPLLCGLLFVLYRRWGVPVSGAWTLVALLALNGNLALFGTLVMSEVLFTALLAATMIAVDRQRWLLAGLLGACAFLTRTTGLVLLVAVPVGVWMHRRHWKGLIVSAVLLPFAAAWSLWTRMYRSSGNDHMTAYYSDYVKDLLWNATPSNYHLILWNNYDQWLSGVAELLVQDPGMGPISHPIMMGLVLFAVFGVWRLCRQYRGAIPYALTGLLMSLMLIAWCYPPNERLVFPVFPVLLAGIVFELTRFARTIADAWKTQRAAAVIFGVVFAGMLSLAFWRHFDYWWDVLPDYYSRQTRVTADNNACYERIQTELPASATFAAHHDPVLWLATGRHGIRPMFRTALWYEGRLEEIPAVFKDAVGFARRHELRYVFQNRLVEGDMNSKQFREYWDALQANPELEPVFTCGMTRVWRVRE
ncbi:MAG: hypothetical protein SGI92_08045 [Bryobacteraceae bacterium]|nr:hypothetical protein [Bryobacteraceae bacterium]